MLRVAFALSFGLLTNALLNAQPTDQAAAQLAARISSLLPRHPTVLLVASQNLSTLPAGQWSSFRSQLEAELRKAGVELAAGASSDQRVSVTLADNSRGMLLVGEVTSPDNRQVAMLPWNPPTLPEDRPRTTLTKKLLWAQPEPILDVLLLDSSTRMLVLGTSKVVSFRFVGSAWTPGAAVSLVLPRPLPRDPRGRIEASPEGFRAYLPGATCIGSLEPDLKITCTLGNEIWPDAQVRWVGDRNVLESDSVKGPFYTVANGIFAMADGHGTGPDAWGSDITAIQGTCAAVIASSTATDRDSVQAYQNTSPVSDALPLPGPVTALWPSEGRDQATLVVHNLQTGEYEASRLGLACSQ
jgi:hypothetical protein